MYPYSAIQFYPPIHRPNRPNPVKWVMRVTLAVYSENHQEMGTFLSSGKNTSHMSAFSEQLC